MADPAYFMLGEKQFEGVDIYSIAQDKNLNYWFATDNGLFVHDGYTFDKIESKTMKSLSMFGLVLHDNGDLFCFNLNRQVFRIRNKSCSLFFEIPEPGADINLLISGDGEIIISTSAQIFVLDTSGKIQHQYKGENGTFNGPAFNLSQKEVIFSSANTNYIIVYSKHKFSRQHIKFPENHSQLLPVLVFFKHHHSTYAFDVNNKILYAYNPANGTFTVKDQIISPTKNERIRIKQAGGYLWIANLLKGGKLVKPNEDFLISEHQKLFFQDYFISDFFQDSEGNLLLPTFDEGVIVIPNPENNGLAIAHKNFLITKICAGDPHEILLGTDQGEIYSFHDSLIRIKGTGNKRIEFLRYDASQKIIFHDNNGFNLYDRKTGSEYSGNSSAIKDICFAGNTTVAGFNTGLFELHRDSLVGNFIGTPKRLMSERIFSISYEEESNNWYVSSAAGLFFSKDLSSFTPITINQNFIAVIHLYSTQNFTLASTVNNELLIIKNGKIISRVLPQFRDKPLAITKMLVYNGSLIMNTQQGIFLLKKEGPSLYKINKSNGLISDKIFDFCIIGDELWIAHSKGIQKIDLATILSEKIFPELILDQILLNGNLIQEQRNQFNSEEKKLSFSLRSPTLLHRENIRYHYRLKGADDLWNIAEYDNHIITFNALRPGSYTFEARAENQGMFSKPVQFSFTILNPFYLRWWFIVLSLSLLIALLVLAFRRKIKLQQLKAQQLNELHASRLTAIQSQMNPHFIFNSLNSIQDLVLKGELERSYTSITKFSNLVRRTLNQSDKDFIEFEEEVTTIELYLALEKLRFKNDLEVSINTNHISEILIPPMLIQPFVENALFHGLLHKEGIKKIDITFYMKNETLYCEIEDNGIGREMAKKIQDRQRSGHESFATKAISKRFDILKHFFQGELGVEYFDHENGTKVTLKIPHIKRF